MTPFRPLAFLVCAMLMLPLGCNPGDPNLVPGASDGSAQPGGSDALSRAGDVTVGDVDQPFLLAIEEVYSIGGSRSSVVTGRITRGRVAVRDRLDLIGAGAPREALITGIEVAGQNRQTAQAGEAVGLTVGGFQKAMIHRGDVLAKPGSIQARRTFTAEVRLLDSAAGGLLRPLQDQERIMFRIWAAAVTGTVTLPEMFGILRPGEAGTMQVELATPTALEAGTAITLLQGGRTVGTGSIISLEASPS